MSLFKRNKKDFISKVMEAAKKEKEGSLATKIMIQFIPKTELREPPKKKKPHKYVGHKAARKAHDGTIGLTNRHGIAGQAIADIKRNRILASKMKG